MGTARTVALVGMWQETNTYSPRRTDLADFERFELLAGAAIADHHRGTGSVLGGALDALEAAGATAVGVLSAGAWPAGPPDVATTVALLDRLDAALEASADVDAIVVNLHGAMVADGAPDMEHEVLRRIRRRFGARPVAAVMDLHANPSAEAVAACDVLVGYRTYPHVDMRECGIEAVDLLLGAAGSAPTTTLLARLDHLTSPIAQGTDVEPMRGLMARADARAAALRSARVSLFPGFPYSDVDRVGFAVTVTASERDRRRALAILRETLDDVAAHLEGFAVDLPDPETAVRRALTATARPVVLADVADNVGGGGPGDGTALLAELLAQDAQDAVVLLADAEAVGAAHAAGVGAELELQLGARSDALHGRPVPVRACVARLGDGAYRSHGSYMTGQAFSMGRTAVLAIGGVQVVAMEHATPPFHLEQLTVNGIDPAAAGVLVVKGAIAWRDPYRAVTGTAIAVDTPGCCPADPSRLARRAPIVAIAAPRDEAVA